ncbi:MAG: hypothetical protein Q9209_000590 [Squamulea sp. 1 TL-2023]
MWRSVGFLMSFGVVIEGMTLIAFIVVLAGGKQKREQGWIVISGLLVLAGVIQCAGMAIIVSLLPLCLVTHVPDILNMKANWFHVTIQAFLYDNEDRFFPGWKLDISWILCTTSWSILFVLAGGIAATAFLLPSEEGYELIPDAERES